MRVRGTLDADHTDVDLQLLDGDRLLARHPNPDTLLNIGRGEPLLQYLDARMVLLDDEGGLMTEEAVRALAGRVLTLKVDLVSDIGAARAEAPVTLDAAGLD